MENCLKQVPRNCYNTHSSVVLALFVATGVVLIAIASDYESKSSLECDLTSSLFKGKYIETQCRLQYAQEFLPSLSLNVQIVISFGLVVVLSVVYGYLVKHRVDIFANNPNTTTNEGVEESQPLQSEASPATREVYRGSNRSYFVFMAYMIHLIVCRILPLTIFSAFLLTSSNFPTHFQCPVPNMKTTTSTSHENVTRPTTHSSFVDCTYSMAGKKQQVVVGFITINFLVDAVTLVEIVYLLWSALKRPTFRTDQEFISRHLLDKKDAETKPNSPINEEVDQEIPLMIIETNFNSPNQEVNQEIPEMIPETNSNSPIKEEVDQEIPVMISETNSNSPIKEEVDQEIPEMISETNSNSPNQEVKQKIQEMIQENKVKHSFTVPDAFGRKQNLDEIYINVIIQDGRERVNYSRNEFMKGRHEIYDIQLKKPPNAKVLESTAELFQAAEAGKKQPRTVLVVGRPGIGKTVLTQKISQEWKDSLRPDEFWYEKIVLLIKFRNFNKQKTNLQEILDQAHGLNKATALSNNKSIHDYIHQNPSKTILVFDGLDELKVDDECLTNGKTVNSLEEHAHIYLIFKQLVNNELLPGATVLTTSRPTAERIYRELKFDREVEMLGFSEKQIEEYVRKFCGNNTKKSSEIWNIIKDSPELLSFCYVPVNSYIVCLTLYKSIDFGQHVKDKSYSKIPKTMTELYKRAIRILLFKHNSKYLNKPVPKDYLTAKIPEQLRNSLDKLKKIAMQGMEDNQLVFQFDSSDEFMADLADSGVFNQLEEENQYIFSFLHLTIQEFLTALYVVDDIRNVESFLSKHIDEPRWHLVIQFVAGLLGDRMRELRSAEHEDNELNEVIERVCKRFQDWMPNKRRIDESNDKGLLVIKSVWEMQEDRVMKMISSVASEDDHETFRLEGLNIAPAESTALFKFLSHIKNLKKLQIIRCTVMNITARELAEFLKKDNHGLENDNCELTVLYVSGNRGLTTEGVKYLSDALKNDNCKLTKLKVSVYDLKTEGVKYLSDALKSDNCKLTGLNVSVNDLETDGVKYLSDALKSDNCKLTELDVSSNDLKTEDIKYLSDALKNDNCKLTELNLSGNDLTTEGVKYLSDALKNDNCKLTELNLSGNDLTTEGVKYLSDALKNDNCKLTELNVRGNDLKTEVMLRATTAN
ncbi:NACHT, LRR and PYD domains-containing protein 12-like [Dendronephthya gigantea]|uniref:NACHT, LRR and PYD domains-containing protein 12-like n=1 Tax=Dendronephthya gigantea TaxID=151771 RepID=UPI00106D7EB9|nr:NACHT, LRR and PYD domains-containing protein 12-like [Dendronephthya gigantea]